MFIVFEGGEGGGKTTQIELLAEWLRTRDEQVCVTREPGGSRLGVELRRILLDPDGEPNDPRAETLLYAADRAQHVANVIAPALDEGKVVVCDRFIDSSRAYQGTNHPEFADMILTFSLWAAKDIVPDLVIVLDIDVRKGLARAAGRAALDAIESRGLAWHEQVRQRFLDIARDGGDRYLVINAEDKIEEIHYAVVDAVAERLAREQAARGSQPPVKQMTNDPHPFHIVGECQDCCDESEALRYGYPGDIVPGDCETPGCVNGSDSAHLGADSEATP